MAGLVQPTNGYLGLMDPYVKKNYPVAAASTFVAGDILTLTSSGTLQQNIAANTTTTITTHIIAGVALEPALQTAPGPNPGTGPINVCVPIALATTDLYMWMPIYHGTATSAIWNTNLLANGTSNAGYPIRFVSAGIWAVDISTQTDPNVVIVDVNPNDLIGGTWGYNSWVNSTTQTTQYPWVLVRFLTATLAFG